MKIINFIIDLLFCPFTLLLRAKGKNELPKEVKHVVLISIALIFTVAIIFLCYYMEILGIWY